MPPAAKKDGSIILFDMNISNKDLAGKTLMKLFCRKLFTSSKDVTKLYLFNSQKTKNSMNSLHSGYDHIFDCFKKVMNFNPELLENYLESASTDKGNWIDALSLGINSVIDDIEPIPGIVTNQLIFITDLNTPIADYDKDRFQSIIDGINNHSIYLYVMGPNIPLTFPLQEYDDIQRWMSQIEFENSQTNLLLLKEIIDGTATSIVSDLRIGLHLLSSFKDSGGTQQWNVPLALGSSLDFPASTMKILSEGLHCKLTADQGNKVMIYVDCEDELKEYSVEEVLTGITRHGKFVQMSDKRMFKCTNPRSFNILCFTDISNVPEYIMRGETYAVVPNSTKDANEAMNALIDYLAHHNKYAIARRVYNANFRPTFVVLIPAPEHYPRCFLLAQLPYSDDVQFDYREKDVSLAPAIKKNQRIYEFLDKFDNKRAENIQDMPLSVMMMQDPNTERIVNKAADKLFKKEMGLDAVDFNYLKESDGIFKEFREIWPERVVQEVVKQKVDKEQTGDDYDWS